VIYFNFINNFSFVFLPVFIQSVLDFVEKQNKEKNKENNFN